MSFEPILHREEIVALLQLLLEELLLFLGKEIALFLLRLEWPAQTALSAKLIHQLLSLGLVGRQGRDPLGSEVVEHLARDFFKCFFGQLHGIVLEFPEWNKLNDVCGHMLFVLLRVKWFIVSIKLVHR
jgi:hypothetical protein